MSARRYAQSLVISFAALAAVGCTTVTVSGPDGKVSCTGGIVATNIRSPESHLITVRSRGAGVFSSDDGLSVGWFSGTRVYAPINKDRCRVVLIPEDPEDTARFLEVLSRSGINLSEICTAQ